MPKSVHTAGHNIYNPKKSPTAKLLKGDTWNITYGDGSSASGNVYSDTVTLGGLVIKNQAVECAEKLSSAFATGEGDGLLGLAFDAINTVRPGPVPTPVQNLNSEGVTPKVTSQQVLIENRDRNYSLVNSLVLLKHLDSTLLVHTSDINNNGRLYRSRTTRWTNSFLYSPRSTEHGILDGQFY